MRLVWKNCRRLARDPRGSEIAETAMIIPLFFMMFLSIFFFGQAYRIYGTLTSAARDGARAAVNPACTTCTTLADPTTNAWNMIKSDLQAAHIDATLLQYPTTPPPLCACSRTAKTTGCTSGTVLCDSSSTNICVQGVNHVGVSNTLTEGYVQLSPTPASGALTTGPGECGISVSFQYPFQFQIPFTSLGKTVVNLRAQAQMRTETQ
jgi:Flp pilus assembly protein TadG